MGSVRDPDEREVEATGPYRVDEDVGGVFGQGDVDAGIGRVEVGELVEQAAEPARSDHADGDVAVYEPGQLVDRLADRGRGEGGARMGDTRSGAGEPHRLARPVEQGLAELFFQGADLRADARLADVDALRRPGEVRRLGDGDEVFELPQFHKL